MTNPNSNSGPPIHISEVEPGPTVHTDSTLTKRTQYYRLLGEQVFAEVVPKLNELQPGRERTKEEFDQVTLALGVGLAWLLDAPEP